MPLNLYDWLTEESSRVMLTGRMIVIISRRIMERNEIQDELRYATKFRKSEVIYNSGGEAHR